MESTKKCFSYQSCKTNEVREKSETSVTTAVVGAAGFLFTVQGRTKSLWQKEFLYQIAGSRQQGGIDQYLLYDLIGYHTAKISIHTVTA